MSFSSVPAYKVVVDDEVASVVFDMYPRKKFGTGSVLLVSGNSTFSKCVLCSQKAETDSDNPLNITHVAILVVTTEDELSDKRQFVEL